MEFPKFGVRNKIMAAGFAGALSLTGCSGPNPHTPERIKECTPTEAKGKPAQVDSGGANDPQVLLSYVEAKGTYRDHTTGEGFLRPSDQIDGLGELVCKVTGKDDAVRLVFLPENIRVQHDYMESQEARNADRVIQQIRQQTTTSIGPR